MEYWLRPFKSKAYAKKKVDKERRCAHILCDEEILC